MEGKEEVLYKPGNRSEKGWVCDGLRYGSYTVRVGA